MEMTFDTNREAFCQILKASFMLLLRSTCAHMHPLAPGVDGNYIVNGAEFLQ